MPIGPAEDGVTVSADQWAAFMNLAKRMANGREKYPLGCTVASLLDEAGEFTHAVNKEEGRVRLRDELLDVAAVAMRLYLGEVDTDYGAVEAAHVALKINRPGPTRYFVTMQAREPLRVSRPQDWFAKDTPLTDLMVPLSGTSAVCLRAFEDTRVRSVNDYSYSRDPRASFRHDVQGVEAFQVIAEANGKVEVFSRFSQ